MGLDPIPKGELEDMIRRLSRPKTLPEMRSNVKECLEVRYTEGTGRFTGRKRMNEKQYKQMVDRLYSGKSFHGEQKQKCSEKAETQDDVTSEGKPEVVDSQDEKLGVSFETIIGEPMSKERLSRRDSSVHFKNRLMGASQTFKEASSDNQILSGDTSKGINLKSSLPISANGTGSMHSIKSNMTLQKGSETDKNVDIRLRLNTKGIVVKKEHVRQFSEHSVIDYVANNNRSPGVRSSRSGTMI
ncbi:hypothetical protein CHS0354_031405 [Potamilus streckersoni]|uniref:Uncharacterized protein n=1 Tax=Potamilus streckersoni TaxID=2493646 RepID=A0AAE0S2G9_9BIVA|nr:hypothetical protein CHS0354_031405 [Potamilus streckersoni]